MTNKTRNEYIALAVILIVLGYILYRTFGGGTPNAPVNGLMVGTETTGSTNQFLPNGADLNTGILQNQLFTTLVPLPVFTVSSADVGISNPFGPASANASTPAAPASPVNGTQSSNIPTSAPGQPSAVLSPTHK